MVALTALNVHVAAFDGLCTELESNGDAFIATVAFRAESAPALGMGDTAHIRFLGGGLVGSVETEGQNVHRSDDVDQRRYSFKISNVPRSMLMLLANRRDSNRKAVRSKAEIRLLDLPREVLPHVVLHDISATGMSIVVERAVESVLVNQVSVRVEVSQAGEAPIILAATIRHRRMHKTQVLYGLQFEGQPEEFMHAQQRLLRSHM